MILISKKRIKKKAKKQKDFITKHKAENENLKNQISVFAKTKITKKAKRKSV